MDVPRRITTRWWEDSQSMASQDGYYPLYTGVCPSQANPLDVTPSSGYESPDAMYSLTTTNPTQQSLRQCSCGCMDPSSEGSGSTGVVNVTLNCNVHLGSSPNDQQKVPNSSQYTIECSPEIFIAPTYPRQPVATYVSPDRHRKDSYPAGTVQHSTERDKEGPSLPESGRLTPATSSANQEILEYLSPQLLQYMNPMALLPYLQRHALVSSTDVDYICNSHRTDEERRWRVLRYAPYKGPNAFEEFVQCLSEEPNHTGHKYLARRLHEAMERKRTNPFKRLGSIRQRLYTDDFEEAGFKPYHVQRLPTYPPADTIRSTPRHPPTTRERQESVTSSEESDVFGVADEHDCSPRPRSQGLFSTRESLLEECDGKHCKQRPNIPARPQTPTPYSENWSRRMRIDDDDSDHKRSIHNRPPTPYSTRGSDEDEEDDDDSHREHSQAPHKPPTPAALSKQRSGSGSRPKAAKGRKRSDSRRGAGIRRTPSEIKEKHSERKFQWLQDKVQFSECPEEMLFGSRTHYCTEREILYSGTLHEHGKARFVVLLSDMLLVLKARKQGKSPHMEWFADQEYSMKTPLLLHFLTVQRLAKKASAEHFCLHYKKHSQLVEICLKACSQEAKGIWVHELSEAIKACTAAHAATILPTGNKVSGKPSGRSYTKLALTVFGARHLTPPSDSESHSLYCAFTVGRNKCRTHAVQDWPYPVWNFRCEFSDFTKTDTLLISIYSENTFQPDDFLGSVEVPLVSIPEEKLGLQVMEKQLPLTNGSGKISVHAELGWETKM